MSWRVADLARAMEAIAPPRCAARWDNVGLLVGDATRAARRACCSPSTARLDVAARRRSGRGCEAVVAYHPPMFEAAEAAASRPSSRVRGRARGARHLLSAHGARRGAGRHERRPRRRRRDGRTRAPLRRRGGERGRGELKLVTFVPGRARRGREPRALSRRAPGASASTRRAASARRARGRSSARRGRARSSGRPGRLEEARRAAAGDRRARARACPRSCARCRAAHPYEEPAFDLVRLALAPADVGLGRVGSGRGRVRPGPGRAAQARPRGGSRAGRGAARSKGVAGRRVRRQRRGPPLRRRRGGRGALRHRRAPPPRRPARRRRRGWRSSARCTRRASGPPSRALEQRLSASLAGLAISKSTADREPFAFACSAGEPPGE